MHSTATLIFPTTEGGTESYVHWLGKGQAGQQEWVFRIYSADNNVGRANRTSFYVFNLAGGLGVGSPYQDPNNPVQVGVWIQVVGAADTERTYIYISGHREQFLPNRLLYNTRALQSALAHGISRAISKERFVK